MSGSVKLRSSPFKHLLEDQATRAKTFRHLLRDLLRETTYLPDPWLRTYHRSYILQRYRTYLHAPPTKPACQNAADHIQTSSPSGGALSAPQSRMRKSATRPDKQYSLFLHARSELRTLARANIGHEKPLFRLMSRAYGRSGPRRYRLLRKIWNTDIPADSDGVKALLQTRSAAGSDTLGASGNVSAHSGRIPGQDEGYIFGQVPWTKNVTSCQDGVGPKPIVPELPSDVRLLIKAQLAAKLADTQRKSLVIIPNIPKENIWGRPVPVVRQRNIIADWLLKLKRNLLPPLPDHEFIRLRQLVNGQSLQLTTPALPRGMPSVVKIKDYGSTLAHPPRRPLGTDRYSSEIKLGPGASRHDGLKQPNKIPGKDNSVSELDFESADNDEDHDGIFLPLNPENVDRHMVATRDAHYLNPKYLRRLYARLLDLSSRMSQVNGKNVLEWGREQPEWKLSPSTKRSQKPDWNTLLPEAEANGMPRDTWMFRMDDPV